MIVAAINFFEVGQHICRYYIVKCLVHKDQPVKVYDVKNIKWPKVDGSVWHL